MAIDSNFLTFLVPAIIVVLAAAVAFPSKARIQRDPSTAYGGGRKALVILAAVLALVFGAILAALGFTQNVEPVVANLNMVQIGGISLVVMGVVLLVASSMVTHQIRKAGRGEREQVLEVAAVARAPPPGGAPPPMGPPPGDLPPRDLPPRDLPPRDLPPRPPPREGVGPRQGMPPPRDLPPRPMPPPRNGAPPPPRKVERRPPPPRYPPPE